MSLVLGQIKTQELVGGAERRQPILGFYVLVRLATAICNLLQGKSLNSLKRGAWKYSLVVDGL
jgi:hypothetical protein